MKGAIALCILVLGIMRVHALVISEVMSNPTGDDSGREWVEIYNDTASDIDLASMSISIKGGSFVVATPLQGGLMLPANGYAIIGSTVSGATKFLQDYPSFSGPLFRASVSLVNSGATSIDIKLGSTMAAGIPSYTAAKEGQTLSFITGSYVAGTPTPGAENKAAETSESPTGGGNATSTETQLTLPQMSPPTADIILYLPEEKVVVAGAESEFSVFALNRSGKTIDGLRYAWSFGDGGQGTGSSTKYRYVYSGRYVAYVEATNASITGTARMVVRVVPPDISIGKAGSGNYGTYVDVLNPNPYDLDLSEWSLVIDGAGFPFPKHTILSSGGATRFSGLAMGFASTTVATSSVVKILFPNLEEVTRYVPPSEAILAPTSTMPATVPLKTAVRTQAKVLGVSTVTKKAAAMSSVATSSQPKRQTKDTRLVAWFRKLFE